MTEVVVDNGKAFVSEESATIATEAAAQAKQWAEESERQANLASNDSGLARDWAVKMDGKVNNEDYSSKYYAQQAASVPYNGVIATGSTQRRMLTDRFADVINVKDYGAKGDGVTDDSAAFALVEAKENQNVYVPEGVYKLNSYNDENLTKNYFGFGEFLYGNGRHKVLVKQENPMVDASSPILVNNRSVVFIGDSITAGFSSLNPGPTSSYVDIMQKMLSEKLNSNCCNRASFCNMDYETKTGTWTRGTEGPIKRSIILNTGATISFYADYVDLVQVFYKKKETTTTITVSCSAPSITETLTTIPGNSIDRLEISNYFYSNHNAKITITNTGENSIEITGIGLYTQNHTGGVYFHNFSSPGYTTENYANNDVLNAIVAQTFGSQNAPIYIIELGTNDCYASLVSPSDFKNNLDYIVSGILSRAPTAGIALCQPWVKYGNGARNGTPEKYRDAINAIAVKYGCSVFDGAELALNRYNSVLRADDIHPSAEGYKLLARWFWKKLGLDTFEQPDIISFLTPAVGVTLTGMARVLVKNKRAYLNGHIDLGSSIDIQSNTELFTVEKRFAPKNQKYFASSSNGAVGTVLLTLETSGKMKIINKTASSIRYIFLEGLNWTLEY